MSPTWSFVGSTGATRTSSRLRINGIIEDPVGRNSTVAPPATRAATASIFPIQHRMRDRGTTVHGFSAHRAQNGHGTAGTALERSKPRSERLSDLGFDVGGD